jgi:hypothetical protein
MLALVSITTTLVLAFDAVNDRKFTQAYTIPQWGQVSLGHRSGDP